MSQPIKLVLSLDEWRQLWNFVNGKQGALPDSLLTKIFRIEEERQKREAGGR